MNTMIWRNLIFKKLVLGSKLVSYWWLSVIANNFNIKYTFSWRQVYQYFLYVWISRFFHQNLSGQRHANCVFSHCGCIDRAAHWYLFISATVDTVKTDEPQGGLLYCYYCCCIRHVSSGFGHTCLVTLKVSVSRDFQPLFVSWFKPIQAPDKQT